jgi:hypothetical protein
VRERRARDPERRLCEQCIEPPFIEPRRERVQPRAARRRAPLARRAERVEHAAAADRARRLRVANDEAIARQRKHRLVEHQLHAHPLPGREHVAVEQRDVRDAMQRAEMHVQRRPVRQRQSRIGEQRQFDVEPRRRCDQPRIGDGIAALDVRLLDAGQVQRAALARMAGVHRPILRMDAAHACRAAGAHDRKRVAGRHAARERGSRHDGALPGEREHAIDGEPEQPVVAARARANAASAR